ncbi:hypothetical protein J2785_007196 [Burkholderia ambifaria]|nr:hypothetical protein [Burkholderia ambifaria]
MRTNRMPVSAARFETGKRPGFFSRRGLSGGTSSMIGCPSPRPRLFRCLRLTACRES